MDIQKKILGFLKSRPFLLAPLIRVYGRRFRHYGCTLSLDATGRKLALTKKHHKIFISLPHNSYLEDVAREFDYFFESVVPESDGKNLVADFSGPKLHSVPGVDIKFLFTSLPEGGSTNNAYLQSLRLAPGEIVIDAGAYCGLTSYLFARKVGPEGLVIAIEADPTNYNALVENIARSGETNILPLHAALWKERGTLQFQAEGIMGSSLAQTAARHDDIVDVPALTLADVMVAFNLERVDHIKMDIEGAEYEVILSSADFITKYNPDFIIEAHPVGKDPVNVPRLSNFCNRCEIPTAWGGTLR